MKKIICTLLSVGLLLSFAACTVDTSQTGSTNLSNSTLDGASSYSNDQVEKYTVGQTWEVKGQWKLTINSAFETDYRNEFYSDHSVAAVYIIDFTYENLGYVDSNGIMDGLYFNLDDMIVDSNKTMGYSYPGDISKYPQETPVGAQCNGEVCIGVDNAGPFEITVIQYDGNGNKQKAVFSLNPQQGS